VSDAAFGVWVYCAHCGRHYRDGINYTIGQGWSRSAGDRDRARRRGLMQHSRVEFIGDGRQEMYDTRIVCPDDGVIGPYSDVEAARALLKANPRQTVRVRLHAIS